MKHPACCPLAVLLAASATLPATAGFLVTIEAPGVQWTTATGTFNVETFDADHVAAGNYTTWSSTAIGGTYDLDPANLGTFTIAPPDLYGGALGTTQYLRNNRPLNDNGAVLLTLDLDRAYFGFWWSAGSPDEVRLYDNGSEVFSFTTQAVIDTINVLPNTTLYYGNPNPAFLGQNPGEPYVFINFFATGTSVFDQVWLQGNLLETDNHTVSTERVNPTGTPLVPEPGTGLAAGVLALGLAGYLRRRAWLGA